MQAGEFLTDVLWVVCVLLLWELWYWRLVAGSFPFDNTTTIHWQPWEHLWWSHYKCTSMLLMKAVFYTFLNCGLSGLSATRVTILWLKQPICFCSDIAILNGFLYMYLTVIILGNICIANHIRQPQRKLPTPSDNCSYSNHWGKDHTC